MKNPFSGRVQFKGIAGAGPIGFPSGLTIRKPNPPKIPAQLPVWCCPQIAGLECRAATKSEARAELKKILNVERLAAGFKIEKKEPDNVPAADA